MPQRRNNLYDPYALPRRFYNRRIRPNADAESEEDEDDHIRFKKKMSNEEYKRRYENARRRGKALSEKAAKEKKIIAESKATGKAEAARRLKEAKQQRPKQPRPIQRKAKMRTQLGSPFIESKDKP